MTAIDYEGETYTVLTAPMDIVTLEANVDRDCYVKGVVSVDFNTVVNLDFEGFLDLISDALVGSELLMDTKYKPLGVTPEDELLIFVEGDASAILDLSDQSDEEEEDETE